MARKEVRVGKNWAPTGITVWILLYSHRHGLDVWAFGNEDKAIRGAVDLILQDLDDQHYDDIRKEFKELVEQGKLTEAIELWQDLWLNDSSGNVETIDIEKKVVE